MAVMLFLSICIVRTESKRSRFGRSAATTTTTSSGGGFSLPSIQPRLFFRGGGVAREKEGVIFSSANSNNEKQPRTTSRRRTQKIVTVTNSDQQQQQQSSASTPSSSSLPVNSSDSSKLASEKQQQPKVETTTTSKEDPRVLLLIRILFLVYYGSLGSIMPYLPVYYHSLGHGGQIIGMLGAIKPLATFLVAPLWGAISDQTHNPFFILQLTFLTSLLGQLLVALRHDPWYITTMVFLSALFNAPVKTLLDTMVLDQIHDRASFGRLRLWGQLGFGIGSSGVGYLLSKSNHVAWADTPAFSPSFQQSITRYPLALQSVIKYLSKSWQSLTGYKLLFLTYALLSIPTWICIKAFQSLDREAKSKRNKQLPESGNQKKIDSNKGNKTNSGVGHGLALVFQNTDAVLFFVLVLVIGISSGVIENFAYVRIREVGGTGKDMGISRLVSSLAGAPMFWFSGQTTQALGADRILLLSLLSYVIRFVIYAAMKHPNHGLPAEAMRGATFAAFWSSATIYAHEVSPPGLHATMLMLVNAMYGGLGQSLGAVVGGKLQHRFGTVKTFWYSAAFDLAFVAAVIVYLGLRTDSNFQKPKPIGDQCDTPVQQQKLRQ